MRVQVRDRARDRVQEVEGEGEVRAIRKKILGGAVRFRRGELSALRLEPFHILRIKTRRRLLDLDFNF